MTSIALNVDTEYQSVRNNPTQPLTVQLEGNGKLAKMFIHPSAPIADDLRKHPIFKSPFAPIDYFGWEWRDSVDDDRELRESIVIDVHLFFSFKDIEFLFARTADYRSFILPYLQRTRRIRVATQSSCARLPWCVRTYDDRGQLKWHRLSIRISDICAMQGSASLNTYAKNVGVSMDTKEYYSPEQKARMFEMYLEDWEKFEQYATGDLPLVAIKDQTNYFFNKIAGLINLNPRPTWGMSTGKVVASMLTEWIANKINHPYKDFHKLTCFAGCKGITALSTTVKNKSLVYTSMTDGGRAVKERDVERFVTGVLVDIDISGCYGNGLKNQKFAVGNPTIIDKPLVLRDFLSKYKSQLLPGLWVARINWDECPFKQDLLISKTEESFTKWEMSVNQPQGFELEEDRCYGASMVLTTNSVYRAALTHDSLQVLKYYSAPQEWKWILDNAVVESAAIYMKRHKVNSVSKKMAEGAQLSDSKYNAVDASKEWIEVDLNEIMTVLLTERTKHPKGTEMNAFLKLIINAMYGCIASEYFSEKGTGISNVIVGNNITARARVLAWAMAKGLHSHCSITDGGVFDINKVLDFDKKSLNLLEGLHRDSFKDPLNRKVFAVQVPLMGFEANSEVMDELIKKSSDDKPSKVDLAAWQHLKKTFPKLDIFNYDQFSFETKKWYVKLTMHSKVDYRLVQANGKTNIALRGMPKVQNDLGERVINPVANQLFDAIESGTPLRIDIADRQLLSLADWERDSKNRDRLTPHDEVDDSKTFYSDTPLAARYRDMSQYKWLIRDYEKAKATKDPKNVKSVRLRENA